MQALAAACTAALLPLHQLPVRQLSRQLCQQPDSAPTALRITPPVPPARPLLLDESWTMNGGSGRGSVRVVVRAGDVYGAQKGLEGGPAVRAWGGGK